MPNLRSLGAAAEDRAAEYLAAKGYTIVTRRKKMRHGELDLIALDGEVLVFVEVKHRSAPGYVPEESIGSAKERALQLSAEQYIVEMSEEARETRFDLIAMDSEGIRHYLDIFRG
ncbi:MAG: YraN family protein [Fimbriimonas sp.]